MNGHIDDKAFEEYLKRGSPVSQHYQALEPDDIPAELDREVLARANEAVRTHAAKRRSWQRWSVPVALAASTILAVSIVIQSGQHEATLMRAPSYPEPVQGTRHEPARAEERIAESPAEQEKAAPAPSQARRERDEQVAVARERALVAADERRQKQTEARSPVAASAASDASGSLQQKRAEPKAENSATGTAQREDERERRYEAMRTASRGPAPPPPAGLQQAPSAARPTTEISRPRFADELQSTKAAHRNPEEWLREIRELRAAGKTEEADREWKAFRKAFPDHIVAEDDPALGQ